MDCKIARLMLEFSCSRSAELDSAEAGALDAHLQECSACQTFDQLEREIDARIASAMQTVPVPADLHERLARQMTRRHWAGRRRSILKLAAAAVLLVGIAFGGHAWFSAHRPALDLEALGDESAQLRGAQPKQVEDWFLKTHGLRASLPREFNYEFLDSCSVQEFLGCRVPALLFAKGSNTAEVLVLNARQLNLESALRNPRADSGGVTIELRPDPVDPDRVYLVIYTGGLLDWLIAEGGQPTI